MFFSVSVVSSSAHSTSSRLKLAGAENALPIFRCGFLLSLKPTSVKSSLPSNTAPAMCPGVSWLDWL